MNTDILIVGSGCSGLYCALHLPKNKKITIITKSEAEKSDSFLAQGGICVLKDESDYDAFFEDTLKAGHFENDKKSVDIMIRSSRDVIDDLVDYGVRFSRNEDGSFNYTKEGAHSQARILFHRDITGQEITEKLLKEAKKRENITILEHTTLLDIIEKDGVCVGAVIALQNGEITTVSTEYTVLATGGIGGLYRHSTNYSHLTGDGVAISLKHNIELLNLDYVQIHPTTFYQEEETEKSFLISESVRGEGAKLYNKDMERFTDELLPRDLLTKEIKAQMEKDKTEFVWEDLRTIPKEELKEHFPNIIKYCKDNKFDPTKECIPVVPAQHYFMGGIKVDYNSKTSMDSLYAIGETACNGVHGRNRLASNSLLESLVFAKRAALDMSQNEKQKIPLCDIDLDKYKDRAALEKEYKKLVLDEIENIINEKEKKQNV
ncbi:MAG: L-aspartate oxidase [Clostridia bacterium]|nr:L-aspartate oxidase [Clostridia bacterium]